MKLKSISLRMIKMFLFLGICGIVNGEGNRIIFHEERSLMSMLNLTNDQLQTRTFGLPETSDGTCRTLEGQTGKCIDLEICPELSSFVKINGLQSVANVNFLKSRICKKLFRSFHLCCIQEQIQEIVKEKIQDGAQAAFDENIQNGAETAFDETVGDGDPNSGIIPSLRECGSPKIASRIIGGINTKHGDHPWLVAVGIPEAQNRFRVLCGGTLITKRHVLTVAHCFVERRGYPSVTHVRLGDYSLSQNNESLSATTLMIKDRKNPGYNSALQLNDIELLTLEKDVQFTKFIEPACLPFEFQTKNFENEKMTIVGWGDTFFGSSHSSDVPIAAEVTVWSKSRCHAAYQRFPQLAMNRSAICANGLGKDSCQGDSGGPLLYNRKNNIPHVYIVGISSFGIDCGNVDFPGVYTFVPAYSDWIKANL